MAKNIRASTDPGLQEVLKCITPWSGQAGAATTHMAGILAALLDAVGVLVVIIDPQGRIRYANAACEPVTGLPAAQASGRRFPDLFVWPEHIPVSEQLLHRQTAAALPADPSVLLMSRDGSRRLAWSLTPLRDGRGQTVFLVATGIDPAAGPPPPETAAPSSSADRTPATSGPAWNSLSGLVHTLINPLSFIVYNVPMIQENWDLLEPIIQNHAAVDPQWRQGGATLPELCQEMRDSITAIQTGADRITQILAALRQEARSQPGDSSPSVGAQEGNRREP